MQVGMTIWNCHQLRRLGAVDFRATVNFAGMKVRSKNAVLYALKNGWIRSGWVGGGSGMLAHRLMVTTDVFFVATRLRTGRSRWNSYQYVDWRWRKDTPAWFVEKLQDIFTADRTAATIASMQWVEEKYKPDVRFVPFYVLKLQDHLPGILADYVATPEYKAAVAPLIALVEEGGQIEVAIDPPKGRSWRT